jgi:exosortase O
MMNLPSRPHPGWHPAKPFQLLANALLVLLWLWLFRPVYPYLATIFTRQEFRTNQIVLLAVLALFAVQVRRGGLRLSPADLPQLQPAPLALALGGCVGFVLVERHLDINTLSATLFGLATYGLLGLWMTPRRWRQGLPAALLLVGVLPFGEHMETFAGYPLRILTARLVSQAVAYLGTSNLGVDTILVFENGISQVDNPCSGVKSLWTGGLFFLAATWIERRPLNWRWALAAIVFAACLLAANLLRVFLLVLVGQVASWRLLAEMLHVPLGVVGFVAACAAALWLLRWAGQGSPQVAPQDAPQEAPESLPAHTSRPLWLAPALGLALLALALLYVPPPQPASAAPPAWQLPPGLLAEEWSLTPGELDWLTSDNALPVSAARWRFTWGELSGSLLLITSDTWRAHHRPERCFTVYGLHVQASQPLLAQPDFSLRWLTLGAERGNSLYSAAYWLQSSTQATDDYAARMWDDFAPQPQPWVLVTLLFDQPADLSRQDALDLFIALRQAIDNHMP